MLGWHETAWLTAEAAPCTSNRVPLHADDWSRVGRALQLHITAGAKVHAFPLGQLEHQFLDEGRDVVVGLNGALPLLDSEHFLGNLNFHVLFDRGLAGQTPAVMGFPAGEVGFLGGQHGAAALGDHALALGAGSAAATGGGQEQVGVRQGSQQFATGGDGDGLLAVDLDRLNDPPQMIKVSNLRAGSMLESFRLVLE